MVTRSLYLPYKSALSPKIPAVLAQPPGFFSFSAYGAACAVIFRKNWQHPVSIPVWEDPVDIYPRTPRTGHNRRHTPVFPLKTCRRGPRGTRPPLSPVHRRCMPGYNTRRTGVYRRLSDTACSSGIRCTVSSRGRQMFPASFRQLQVLRERENLAGPVLHRQGFL